ncbi:MAG: hypothetical protein ACUVWP_03305 [bacterium]
MRGLIISFILCLFISISFSYEIEIALGKITIIIDDPKGISRSLDMPQEENYDVSMRAHIYYQDPNTAIATFDNFTQVYIFNSNPISPPQAISSIYSKPLTFHLKDDGTVSTIDDIENVTTEFNPISTNLICTLLFPPIDNLMEKSVCSINYAFPLSSDEKTKIDEKMLVEYTFAGESEYMGKTCEVITVNIKSEELTSIKVPIGGTIGQAFGTGEGTIMFIKDIGVVWAEISMTYDRNLSITLTGVTYPLSEKVGIEMGISSGAK